MLRDCYTSELIITNIVCIMVYFEEEVILIDSVRRNRGRRLINMWIRGLF